MKLHRTGSRPDWETVKPADFNFWQSTASASRGLITPGNLITAAGLGAVIYALVLMMSGSFWYAVIWLGVGRLMDLADGLAAEASGTKSPLGEAMDASADKFGTFLTLITAALSGAVSWWIAAALALPHIIISIIVVISLMQSKKFHPSRIGKLSMAVAWVALLGLIMLHASGQSASGIFGLVAYGLSGLSIVMAAYAAIGYWRDLVK